MNDEPLIVHIDGGARGNPGPAACAFVLERYGKIVEKRSKFLAKSTNNFAEYQAVIFALSWIVEKYLSAKLPSIIFYSDSELVVRQLTGLYRTKNENLKRLVSEIFGIISDNKLNIIFRSVPRSQNKLADFLVNRELDLKKKSS